jgi:hypothetical protein
VVGCFWCEAKKIPNHTPKTTTRLRSYNLPI